MISDAVTIAFIGSMANDRIKTLEDIINKK